MNCPNCDLPLATQADFDTKPVAVSDSELCWREWYESGDRCANTPIDWRTRALTAEAQLDEAYLAFAALTAERDASLRREGRAFVRSYKRREAIRRVVRYCRAVGITLSAAIDAAIKLGRQVNDRDLAIDALTARVAELMPCHDRVAFVDGELDADRAAAFRMHLRGCKLCREGAVGDAQLSARLSTLGGEP